MELHGEIHFPDVVSPVEDATLHVRLLDVSRADAAAETVAADSVEHVSVTTSGRRIPFAIVVDDLDERHAYAIEAHLDIDGSGEVERGDYRTMEHFGVSPTTIDQPHLVACRPIR